MIGVALVGALTVSAPASEEVDPALAAVRYMVSAGVECGRAAKSSAAPGYGGCTGALAGELYAVMSWAADVRNGVGRYLGAPVRVTDSGSIGVELKHPSLKRVPIGMISCHVALDDPGAVACLVEPRARG